jgi:hypothetical protein
MAELKLCATKKGYTQIYRTEELAKALLEGEIDIAGE